MTILKNTTTQKIISSSLVILVLAPTILFFLPKQARAFSLCPPAIPTGTDVPVADISTQGSTGLSCATDIKSWAQKLLEIAGQIAAQKLSQYMTQAVVGWINNGFHGSPLFLQNSDSFFQDIAKSEVKNLVTEVGYNPQMFPFGKDWALNAISSYKSTLANNMAYTLNGVMTPDEVGNFAIGGWNGFLVNTQYPQNNYLGSNMMITEELARELQGTTQTAAQKVQTTLQQGNGFLSPQTCPSNPAYNNGVNEFQRPSFDPSTVPYPEAACEFADDQNPTAQEQQDCKTATDIYNQELATAKAKWATQNTCPGGLVNTTPGYVVASQITKALGVPQDSATISGVLGNGLSSFISAVVNALFNKLIGSGLDALSGNNSSSPVDNWSYNGQNLGGSSTGSSALNVPSSVSIQMGDPTTNPSTTTISGGTAPYSKQTTSPITPDVTVATASIDPATNLLTIKGVDPGTTSVTIQDSSSPARSVTIEITVVGSGDLMATPANITLANFGDNGSATISNGKGNYTVTADANQSIAKTQFSGSTLVAIGMGAGTTSVTIQDSSSPTPKTTTINITVAEDLTTNPSDISNITVGGSINTSISGGKPPYNITGLDKTIASTSLSSDNSTLTITGNGEGTTSATITDSSSPTPKTTIINITVTAQTGTCTMNGVPITGIPRSACTGSWVPGT